MRAEAMINLVRAKGWRRDLDPVRAVCQSVNAKEDAYAVLLVYIDPVLLQEASQTQMYR